MFRKLARVNHTNKVPPIPSRVFLSASISMQYSQKISHVSLTAQRQDDHDDPQDARSHVARRIDERWATHPDTGTDPPRSSVTHRVSERMRWEFDVTSTVVQPPRRGGCLPLYCSLSVQAPCASRSRYDAQLCVIQSLDHSPRRAPVRDCSTLGTRDRFPRRFVARAHPVALDHPRLHSTPTHSAVLRFREPAATTLRARTRPRSKYEYPRGYENLRPQVSQSTATGSDGLKHSANRLRLI